MDHFERATSAPHGPRETAHGIILESDNRIGSINPRIPMSPPLHFEIIPSRCYYRNERPVLCLIVAALLCTGLLLSPASAQDTQKTWIFFTDKLTNPGKTTQLETGYLSEQAIERRQRRGSHFPAIQDAPISSRYLHTLEGLGVEIVHHSRWLNAVSAFMDAQQRSTVQQLPFVRQVQPVRLLSPHARRAAPISVPAARPLSRSIDCGQSCRQLQMVNAEEPLDNLINGQGVKIGFLDTRFDVNDVQLGHFGMSHLSDAGKVRYRNFTADDPGVSGQTETDFHGLEVASVALSNATGHLIGPCHGADTVYVAQTEWTPLERNVEEDNFVAGVEWMEAGGVDIINSSLGYTTFDPGEHSYTPADMDGDTGITTIALDMAAQRGVVPVAGAGNVGDQSWGIIITPADGDSVIAVGGIWADSSLAYFSSTGPTADGRVKPDVAALGFDVFIATPDNSFHSATGTSYAAPMVSGIVCQILQVNPNLNPHEVWEVLTSTAHQSSSPDNSLGWGIPNAQAAIDQAIALYTSIPETPQLPSTFAVHAPYPNPFMGHTSVDVELSRSVSSLRIAVYNMLGQQVYSKSVGPLAAGTHSLTIEGQPLTAGMYTYAVEADGEIKTGLMIHVR